MKYKVGDIIHSDFWDKKDIAYISKILFERYEICPLKDDCEIGEIFQSVLDKDSYLVSTIFREEDNA